MVVGEGRGVEGRLMGSEIYLELGGFFGIMLFTRLVFCMGYRFVFWSGVVICFRLCSYWR